MIKRIPILLCTGVCPHLYIMKVFLMYYMCVNKHVWYISYSYSYSYLYVYVYVYCILGAKSYDDERPLRVTMSTRLHWSATTTAVLLTFSSCKLLLRPCGYSLYAVCYMLYAIRYTLYGYGRDYTLYVRGTATTIATQLRLRTASLARLKGGYGSYNCFELRLLRPAIAA